MWSIADLESVHLSPTNHCNFDCIMCPTPRMKNEKGYLAWKTFEKAVEELRGIRRQGGKFNELHFYLEGEPFLNRNYLEMLKSIDQALENVTVIVSTNGFFLAPEVTDEIFELVRNRYVYLISIDASNHELYKRIKPKSDYRTVERNVEYFLSRKKSERVNNPYLALQFIVMSVNEDDRHEFYWKWEPLLGPKTKAAFCLYEDRLLQENSAHIYWKRYYSRSHPLREEDRLYSRNYGPEFPSRGKPRVCVWLWKKLVIGWDGDIKVCCFYPESSGLIGNVNEYTLKQLFEGEKMRRFRSCFLNRQAERAAVCGQCPPIAWAYDKRLEEELGLC